MKEVRGATALLKIIQEIYPDTKLGLFCGDYGSLHGVFEDFENSRIFYFPGHGSYDSVKIHRNGELQSPPYGKAIEVKVADQTYTFNGDIVDEETSSSGITLGHWIGLEATDTFRMSFGFPNPLDGTVEIFYNPDAKWRASKSWSEKKIPKPADAYEFVPGSLLVTVKKVLEAQEKCLVRLESSIDFEVSRAPEEDGELEFKPLVLDLRPGKKLGGRWDMEWGDLANYFEGARAAEVEPFIRLKVEAKSKDELFRKALNELAQRDLRRVQLIWMEE